MGRMEGLGGRFGREVKPMSAIMPDGKPCATDIEWMWNGCGMDVKWMWNGCLGMMVSDF